MNLILLPSTIQILEKVGRYENSMDCIHIWIVYKRIAVDMVFLEMKKAR